MLNYFLDQQGYDNYCHKLESSVAEYFKVEFLRSPSSKVIKVIPIVLKVIRMSKMKIELMFMVKSCL